MPAGLLSQAQWQWPPLSPPLWHMHPIHSKWSWAAADEMRLNMTTEKIRTRISCLFILISAKKKNEFWFITFLDQRSQCSEFRYDVNTSRCGIQTRIKRCSHIKNWELTNVTMLKMYNKVNLPEMLPNNKLKNEIVLQIDD